MGLSFHTDQRSFSGKYPSKMAIENDDYSGTLFYSENFAVDRAYKKHDRRNLSFSAKPKHPGLLKLHITDGDVVVGMATLMPELTVEMAEETAEFLARAAKSAKELENFISDLFPEKET